MSALSHLPAQASAQSRARLRIDAVFRPPVAPSSAQLRASGPQKSRLSRFTKQARGRFLVAASARSVTQDTKNVDAGREARKEAFSAELVYLKELLLCLARTTNFEEKVAILEQNERVRRFCLDQRSESSILISTDSAKARYVLLCLIAIGQEHILLLQPDSDAGEAAEKLVSELLLVNSFYDSIGGLAGYQLKCLEMMLGSKKDGPAEQPSTVTGADYDAGEGTKFYMPQGLNIAYNRRAAAAAAATGLEALPHMGEILPLGGAGDRLGLRCEVTGESVPTAMLPYCGRSLLSGLIRDLQAREYLHHKIFGGQQITPVAIMTSAAKGNHTRVQALLLDNNYFGRGEESFRLFEKPTVPVVSTEDGQWLLPEPLQARLFEQPMVPVVSAEDGQWLLPEPLRPMMKPGGHGAIWKLMLDRGVFDYFAQRRRQAAIVRQISNPLAGTDTTLLALSGAGYADSKCFGFASCERRAGAAEGVNVLMERRTKRADGKGYEYVYNVTNVEYTEFDRLGVADECLEGSQYSRYPANTNVLYIGLEAAEAAVRAGVQSGGGAALPGMIFNQSKKVTYTDALTGRERSVHAGRMECTMQNLVDSLPQRFDSPVPEELHGALNTFVVYNRRRCVTSSAKRRRAPGSTMVSQTPDGSFLDLMRNARDLLARCGLSHIPEVGTVEQYLEKGPGFIFLFHPALGPMWDVIAQKIRGGALMHGSEVVLEVAEAALMDVRVDGSLLVHADSVMGSLEAPWEAAAAAIRNPNDIHISHPNGSQTLYPATEPAAGSQQAQASHGHSSGAPLFSVGVLHLQDPQPALVTRPKGEQLHSTVVPFSLDKRIEDKRLIYSGRCGRVRLTGVVVRNAGVDWDSPDNCYWQHKVARKEAARIVLHGQSEFEASHVVLEGDQTFEVPDGYKMVVSTGPAGNVRRALFPLHKRRPSWQWDYQMTASGDVRLAIQEIARPPTYQPLAGSQPGSEGPFVYMI